MLAGLLVLGIIVAIVLLPELALATLVGFVGALVGILYPPKNRYWARLQKVGASLLGVSLLLLLAAYITARVAATTVLFWSLLTTGLVLLIGYLVIGHACRRQHEQS